MTHPGSWRHLLAGCDPTQVAAITSPAAPVLVVAGAGSGKTRVLTRRIAWRIAQEDALARHVLALTFTRKAAGELRHRLAALGLPAGITAGTFHAVALAQLRRRALDGHGRPPVLLESKARLLAPLLANLALPGRAGRGAAGRTDAGRGRAGSAGRNERHELLAAVAGEIEWAKGRLVGPGDYVRAAGLANRPRPYPPGEVAALYEAYERERRRRGLVDFDDLLLELLRFIEEDPELAAAQRWQFAHLFVDELQDATTLQLRLVDAWLGGRSDLFAVGDPRQSVYAWNGADPDAIVGFARRHPGAAVVELETNYRSSPQVVTLAAAALPAAGAPRSGCPDGPVPTLRGFADDEEEASAVATGLRAAHRPGRPWSRLAVLARTNAQLEVIATALDAAGIPASRLGLGGVLEHRAVRRALEQLPRRLDAATLRAYLSECCQEGEGLEPGELAEGREELLTLAQLGEDYLAVDPLPSPGGLLAFLHTAARESLSPARRDAVELATFHRAKGLEWEAVWVTGLEEGLVPISHARDARALEEEQRLLYVALTRAGEELHCSWAAERRFGTRRVRREPSPYLAALEAARRRLEAAPRRDTVATALAASRAALSASRGAPPPTG